MTMQSFPQKINLPQLDSVAALEKNIVVLKKQLLDTIRELKSLVEFLPDTSIFEAKECNDLMYKRLLIDTISVRQRRNKSFPNGLFSDPAWDMLLDLALAKIEQRRISVSSLCIASSVPTTTALRWIKSMIDNGVIYRQADSDDGRRHFIFITEKSFELVKLSLLGLLRK